MEQAKTVLGACTYFIQISSKGKLRMENTKQVKIPVANINVGFFLENTSQKRMWNRKRNKINLAVATTFGVRNKNEHNLCSNINAFIVGERTHRGRQGRLLK